MRRFVLLPSVLLLLLLGCSENEAPSTTNQTTVGAESATPIEAWKGVILETMDSGNYTYVLLKMEEKQIWVAGPQAQLAVGDKVIMRPGGEMRNFKSPTLGRTFEVIYFVRGIELDDGHTHGPGDPGH